MDSDGLIDVPSNSSVVLRVGGGDTTVRVDVSDSRLGRDTVTVTFAGDTSKVRIESAH